MITNLENIFTVYFAQIMHR